MSEPLRLTDEVVALLNVVMPMGVDRLEEFGSALQAVVDVEVTKALRDARDSFEKNGMVWRRLDDLASAIEIEGLS